jgi:hypothetical protein
MISRNGVRVEPPQFETQQLRDIQELISKLEDVNKRLAQPVHAVPLTQIIDVPVAEASVLEAPVLQASVLQAQTADVASA